jgi:hypothetical protein
VAEQTLGVLADAIFQDADEIKEAVAGRELADRAFREAIGLGHVLRGRQAPGTFHRRGDSTPDKPGAQDDLREALEKLREWLDLPPVSFTEWHRGLAVTGGSPWRRAALAKVAQAHALTYGLGEDADRQALGLLGEALWARMEAYPDRTWERDIKAVWPERP